MNIKFISEIYPILLQIKFKIKVKIVFNFNVAYQIFLETLPLLFYKFNKCKTFERLFLPFKVMN